MLSRVQLRTDWKTAQFPSIWSQWSAACLKGLAKQEPDFWGSPSLWSYPSDPSHLPSFLSPLNNLLCSAPPNWRVSDPKTKVCPGEGRVKADSTFISLFPRHLTHANKVLEKSWRRRVRGLWFRQIGEKGRAAYKNIGSFLTLTGVLPCPTPHPSRS